MIMSLFNIAAVAFVLFATNGTARFKHNRYERELYPINLQGTNGWFQTKLSLLVPKNVARYIKNVIDCEFGSNAMKRLDKADLKISLSTSQWGTMAGINSRADQVSPGAFKDSLNSYNTHALGKEMKKLAALKKRQEARNKDLNKGRPS